MSQRAVIAGGFTTGRRVLERVADAVCYRFGFADADVFTFPAIMDDPDKLDRASRGQVVFEHSAALLAVAKCTGMERVVAFNSP